MQVFAFRINVVGYLNEYKVQFSLVEQVTLQTASLSIVLVQFDVESQYTIFQQTQMIQDQLVAMCLFLPVVMV
jgi:hypothetical protein